MSANISDIASANPVTTFNAADLFYVGISPYGASDDGACTYSTLIPINTKGDIFTWSTKATRLPVGTNNQVLTARSTEATGLIWLGLSGVANQVNITPAASTIIFSLPQSIDTAASVEFGSLGLGTAPSTRPLTVSGNVVIAGDTGTVEHTLDVDSSSNNFGAARFINGNGTSNAVVSIADSLTDGSRGNLLTVANATGNALIIDSNRNSEFNVISAGTWNGSAIGEIYGGTGQTTYTLGDIIYSSAANTLSKLAGNTTTTKQYLSQTGDGVNSAAPAWATISGADVTGAALTKADDTNVTLTLGGSPSTALLNAASITAGWTGLLAVSRGGTGAGTFATTEILYGNGTSPIATDSNFTYTAGSTLLSVPNAQVTTGLNVGFSGTPGTDQVQVGDATNIFDYNSGNPQWQFDTSDSLGYNRTTNTLTATIGAATVMSLATNNVTINSSTVTLTQDTNFVTSGGLNGFSVDTSTLSVDGANNRVGIGTTSPSVPLHVSNAAGGSTLTLSGSSTTATISVDVDAADKYALNYTGGSRGIVIDSANTTTEIWAGSAGVSKVLTVLDGLQVGAPTGGDKGTGTINVSADIYKNNSAYTNPDYVLELWDTGVIEKFKDNEGAKNYSLKSIPEAEDIMRKTHRLPGMPNAAMGSFSRQDFLLEKMEEAFIYIIELKKEIEILKLKVGE